MNRPPLAEPLCVSSRIVLRGPPRHLAVVNSGTRPVATDAVARAASAAGAVELDSVEVGVQNSGRTHIMGDSPHDGMRQRQESVSVQCLQVIEEF